MATVRYTTANGRVIAEKRNGVRKFYVADPLGSTVALLDNTQAKTDTFSYWPYGEVQSRTGATPTPFQFVGTQGYYQDSASKTYVRARHLDTQKGQWLTQDPIGLLGRDLNFYRYIKNNPASYTDHLGLSDKPPKRDCNREQDLCRDNCKEQYTRRKEELAAWTAIQLAICALAANPLCALAILAFEGYDLSLAQEDEENCLNKCDACASACRANPCAPPKPGCGPGIYES